MNKFLTKHENLILFLLVSIYSIAILFVLFFGIVGHCESSGALPYSIPDNRSLNSFVPDEIIDIAYQRAVDDARNFLHYNGDLSYLVYSNSGFVNNTYYEIMFIPNPTIDTSVLSDFNYLDNSIRVRANNIQIQRIYVDVNGNIGGGFVNIGSYVDLCGSQTTVSIGDGSFTPNYPFALYGNDIYYGVNNDGFKATLVFTNDSFFVPVIDVGHATPPINDTGHLISNVNPNKPTISTFGHSQPNYPNIDNTDTDSLLESLISVVVYGFSFNSDLLTDITNYTNTNLANLTDYLIDNINRGFNNVVGAIQDFSTDFYNNMVSLFEPISLQLAYITEPIDSDVIVSGITDSGLYNGFEDTKHFFDTFDAIFDIEEPDSFTITIHIEELDFFNSGRLDFDLQPVVLNLGANVIPFRNTLRTFLWCAVSVGAVIFVQKNLPSMLMGGESGGTKDAK